MSVSNPNRMPFLREQRKFPQEPALLSVELDRSYTDIASSVNAREIGVYVPTIAVQTGKSLYINGKRYQGFRQIYTFTAAGNIAHGLTLSSILAFSDITGTFTDGSIWYPLPYVNVVAANNQVSVTVTSANIVITAGGGTPPSITSGYCVLEWWSN